MNKTILGIFGVMLLGFLLWNVYLSTENKNLREENKELNAKFNARLGDVDLLTYDLVTTRDSLRIVLEHLDSVPVIQREFY